MGLHRSMIRLGACRPWLLPDLVGLAWVARGREWYRRPPFLPLPSASYLRWRMETAYGEPDAEPPAKEAGRYLRWAARMRKGR